MGKNECETADGYERKWKRFPKTSFSLRARLPALPPAAQSYKQLSWTAFLALCRLYILVKHLQGPQSKVVSNPSKFHFITH